MVHTFWRWSIGLGVTSVVGVGCGTSCEDDGFAGSNCVGATIPIGQGQTTGSLDGSDASTGVQTSTADDGSGSGSTVGEDDTTTGDDTSTGDDGSTSTGPIALQTWCLDADDDGFGDATACEDLPEDQSPPAGHVQDDGDCDDGDADTFPGAAELDDPDACMRDADDDGYGDAEPPQGAVGGSDCNDADADVPSANACLTWCLDADDDQYGDAQTCIDDGAPPAGYVGNATDCDDADPDAFPGAAPNDDGQACMLDADGDDFGDATPSNGAVTAGTDCDDLEALVFDGCFDCPADTSYCDGDDLAQCNATGTWGVPIATCDFGCDDVGAACWSALTVEAGECAEVLSGSAVALTASPSGGDGIYSYAWSPGATLSPDDAATVSASPTEMTTYQVVVGDTQGNAASDDVTVHVTDHQWQLDGPGCTTEVYGDVFESPAAQPPTELYLEGGEVRCNMRPNGQPNVHVCPQVIDHAQVSFDLGAFNTADNDAIGFVFGWQDPSHFYLVSWKQTTEATPWGSWEQGITIKRIDADDPSDITGEDLGASYDTPHGTILAAPAEFYAGAWDNFDLYRVSVGIDGPTATITIFDVSNATALVTGSITDATYGPGAIGSYDASQRTACTGSWRSSCL